MRGRFPTGRAGVEAPLGEHRDRVLAHLGIDVGALVERDVGPRAGAHVFEIALADPCVRPRDGLRDEPHELGGPHGREEAPHEQPEREEPRVPHRVLGPLHEEHAEAHRDQQQHEGGPAAVPAAATIATPASTQIHHGSHSVGEMTLPVAEVAARHTPRTMPSIVCFTGFGQEDPVRAP